MDRNNHSSNNKTVRTWTIVLCLCILAVGIGVIWRAMNTGRGAENEIVARADEKERTGTGLTQEPLIPSEVVHPVTMTQTPTVAQTQEAQEEKPKEQAEPTALVFSYPVEGEIVLAYSVDSAIYDPTLEQYRTNASVSISAEKGTEVQAAADGVVKEITFDAKKGNTVVIEHEGGWLTTYSQLAEDIPVEVGEAVKQGQVIGSVAQPSRYGSALGDHLDFAMEKDGESVDPKEVLKDE